MQVGRFIKRLINPEPEEKGTTQRDEREAGSGTKEESSTDFIRVEGFSDSQLGEPVSASVEPVSEASESPTSSNEEEIIPEPEPTPEPEPEPEPAPEKEQQTAASLFATDDELREAGIDPDELDQEEPESPEENDDSVPVPEAEPDIELSQESEPEPEFTPESTEEEQPQ